MPSKSAYIKALRWNPNHRRMGPITKAIHESLSRVWNKSIEYGLFELLRSQVMPNYTGMSLGSLLPLARQLKSYGKARTLIGLPERGPRKGYEILGGKRNPHGWQGPALGYSIGERRSNKSITYGTTNRPVFGFRFKIGVFQWWLHEVHPGKAAGGSRGPWFALELMMSSARRYFEENWKKAIPNMQDWIVKDLITIKE